MANTIRSANSSGVRHFTIDTNATVLDLGGALPGKVGSFAIHCKGTGVSGNGITIAATQVGQEATTGWIATDYNEDGTAVAAGTKITADGRYYVRCDHGEKIRLSFEIAGGSWDVTVSQGAG